MRNAYLPKSRELSNKLRMWWFLSWFAWYNLTFSVSAELIGLNYYESTLSRELSLEENNHDSLLLPFNKTRIPGSIESEQIQEFLASHFTALNGNWSIESDVFEENGFTFTNMVFSLGNAESPLILAAHYDSKILPEGFIGGIDSAAPCAILLYIAKFVDTILQKDEFLLDPLLLDRFSGLKIVFFDGEEAINQWAADDSIYGARHLASKWETDGTLDSIELLVLLDLLGSEEHVQVPSYYPASHEYYELLATIEQKHTKQFQDGFTFLDPANHIFLMHGKVVIEDDHIPFLERDVPVLHLIPFPFPSAWHTINDNFDNLSEKSIHRWAILLCEFVVQDY